MVLAVKVKVFPTHTGVLLPNTGGEGIGFTVTFKEETELVHALATARTLNVPDVALPE